MVAVWDMGCNFLVFQLLQGDMNVSCNNVTLSPSPFSGEGWGGRVKRTPSKDLQNGASTITMILAEIISIRH